MHIFDSQMPIIGASISPLIFPEPCCSSRPSGEGISNRCRGRSRQAIAERDPLIRAQVPALARVLPWVGHPPTRNRGTVGGSIANADPSAEIPLVAVTLGAEIMLATPDGPSSMPADDFFIGPMLTTIAPGECVSAVQFPVWAHKRIGVGFLRSERAAIAISPSSAARRRSRSMRTGAVVDIALGVGGVGDGRCGWMCRTDRHRLDAASDRRSGPCRSRRHRRRSSDLHASAAYRRRVAVVLGSAPSNRRATEAGARPAEGAAR